MTGRRVCHNSHIAFLAVLGDASLLTKTVKINQSQGIPGSGIPECTFVKNSYKRSRTSLPSPPLLFIAFFTPHCSPLSERLEQAIMTRAIVLFFSKSQDNLKYQTFAKSCRENSENILFSAMDHRQRFCSSLSESPNAFLKSSPVNPPEDAMLKIRRPVYKRLSKLHATCQPKR